jgi:hypothetical protein
MNAEKFDPMKGRVTESGSGLPEGQYQGDFVMAEHLAECEPDAMTGEGGRKFPKVVFKWKVLGGEYDGKEAIRETPVGSGIKSSYIQVCGWIVGRPLTAKDAFDLTQFVGRKYLLTIGKKIDRNGNPANWRHVSNAMLIPEQK